MNEPLYTHDCDADLYLGQHTTSDGTMWDLYFHDHTPLGKGLLARWGNNDPDNLTSIPELVDLWKDRTDYPIWEAYQRAQQRNLL